MPLGIRTFVLMLVKRISVVLSVADRCEANREHGQFYPWYFENRPLEPASDYLRHNVIFFNLLLQTFVKIAQWQAFRFI